jgi:hypothetical protein
MTSTLTDWTTVLRSSDTTLRKFLAPHISIHVEETKTHPALPTKAKPPQSTQPAILPPPSLPPARLGPSAAEVAEFTQNRAARVIQSAFRAHREHRKQVCLSFYAVIDGHHDFSLSARSWLHARRSTGRCSALLSSFRYVTAIVRESASTEGVWYSLHGADMLLVYMWQNYVNFSKQPHQRQSKADFAHSVRADKNAITSQTRVAQCTGCGTHTQAA